jgi:hypothetical protein
MPVHISLLFEQMPVLVMVIAVLFFAMPTNNSDDQRVINYPDDDSAGSE